MTDERPGAERIYREWNPRYVAYAAAHGRGPAAQLAHDGRKMHEFMIWNTAQWTAWAAEAGYAEQRRRGGGWTEAQHAAYDAWLRARYPYKED